MKEIAGVHHLAESFFPQLVKGYNSNKYEEDIFEDIKSWKEMLAKESSDKDFRFKNQRFPDFLTRFKKECKFIRINVIYITENLGCNMTKANNSCTVNQIKSIIHIIIPIYTSSLPSAWPM